MRDPKIARVVYGESYDEPRVYLQLVSGWEEGSKLVATALKGGAPALPPSSSAQVSSECTVSVSLLRRSIHQSEPTAPFSLRDLLVWVVPNPGPSLEKLAG